VERCYVQRQVKQGIGGLAPLARSTGPAVLNTLAMAAEFKADLIVVWI
jgi:hypothetical protein